MADRICDNCMNRVPADAEKCPKCGVQFENTNPGGALPNGWVLAGRYTVGRYLDIDGEGVTYSAIDGNTLQRVTIKEFMPVTLCATRNENGHIVAKPGCDVLFKTTRMDFTELYGNLLRMGLVEGLVHVLDVVEENNTAYAVLEKIEGPTLTEYLMRMEEPLEPSRALTILRPVLVGVESMHAANVVHRGICPDNIILESGGTAKLGGFATLALRQQGSELKPKLYPGYTAPEQYSATEFEGRYTDIYSLGAVLYRMVTGDTPPAGDERRVQDTLRAPRSIYKDIPNYVSNSIMRALRLNSLERLQSVQDLRMSLSGESVAARPVAPVREREVEEEEEEATGFLGLTKKQLIIGGISLGAVVIVVLIVVLIFLFGGNGRDDASSSSSLASSSSSDVQAGYALPNFVGRTYDFVINNSDYDIYEFADPVEEYSDEVPAGEIIDQTPEAGEMWTEGTLIRLTVSQGPELVAMPDFVSQETTVDAAKLALERLGIKNYAEVNVTNSGNYKSGTVVETSPGAGTEVQPGVTPITLYIAGQVSNPAMPNLVSLPWEDAQAELRKLNITYNEPETVENDGRYQIGAVVETNPRTGATVDVANNQRVTIKVADWVTMPNLSGRTEAEARQILENLKNSASAVNVTIQINTVEDSRGDGIVISTSKDGQKLQQQDTIILNVSKAPVTPPPEE